MSSSAEGKERPRRKNRWKDENKGSGLQRNKDGLKQWVGKKGKKLGRQGRASLCFLHH